MTQHLPQCQNLQLQVDSLLKLLQQEASLRSHYDTTAIQSSLRKAIAPTFEIVFAGAFSAGKSMLINALLERELLYSAEGHATGTECKIAYAEPDRERVVLTFMSEAEIREQAHALCQRLQLVSPNINQPEAIAQLQQTCRNIIQMEGGESKSERAKQASALNYLLEGFVTNRERIHTMHNNTFSMEQFHFSTLQEAASYARRGANSAVLKRVEYYCHHELLKDGNVLVDTPGIDAPVKKDADLTYRKIENPDTSAVVCVLKPASAGDMTSEETDLLEKTRDNPGVRDRVFYVFNRVDETWYNTQLRQRLDSLIQEQFRDSDRIFRTSALLGFYGSQIRSSGEGNRYGLDSLFSTQARTLDGREETPQFVSEFNRYCANSGKLPADRFRIDVRSYESPNENYVRILQSQGSALINQLIQDSGIDTFRSAITRYLTQEKRPLLLATLADDVHPLCVALRKIYLEIWQQLESQPQDVEAIKEQELRQLSRDLKAVGDAFRDDIEREVNEAVASNTNAAFENDFNRLRARMVSTLDQLLNTFSVGEVHQRAQASHRRNSVVPLSGILAEAFYYLSNGLEDVLVESSRDIVVNFFQRLGDRIKQQDYYRDLYRLLGNDGGIEKSLKALQEQAILALENEARTECDRYVRERPEFFAEGTASIWQLRQTLQQACRGYDYQAMVEAEPAIRQLLKLDFEQKVKETVLRTFRQTINQTLNTHLLPAAAAQADAILQQYDQARSYLAQMLDREAEEKIRANQRQQADLKEKIAEYNEAIAGINTCLEVMLLGRKQLPAIAPADLEVLSPTVESGMIEEGDRAEAA
jgi:replication fork clamp-binding protein CrfC